MFVCMGVGVGVGVFGCVRGETSDELSCLFIRDEPEQAPGVLGNAQIWNGPEPRALGSSLIFIRRAGISGGSIPLRPSRRKRLRP